MLKDAEQHALAQAYEDVSRVLVSGHDDCVRVARALEAIDSVLRAAAEERTGKKQGGVES